MYQFRYDWITNKHNNKITLVELRIALFQVLFRVLVMTKHVSLFFFYKRESQINLLKRSITKYSLWNCIPVVPQGDGLALFNMFSAHLSIVSNEINENEIFPALKLFLFWHARAWEVAIGSSQRLNLEQHVLSHPMFFL